MLLVSVMILAIGIFGRVVAKCLVRRCRWLVPCR